MRKGLVSLTAAGALAVAGFSLPSPAQANPVLLIPALIAAGVIGGVAVGGAAIEANQQAYGPPPGGTVYVRPTGASPDCQIMRERVPGGG
jgi:hypothetical protein